MTDFKVGDKVIVDLDTPESAWHKAEGVVTETRNSPHCAKVKITKGFGVDGEERTLYNLTLLPFTYEDIQVGDKIRRTLTRETGTTEVREGTVVSKNGGLAVDKDGPLSYILAYSSDPNSPLVVLELLDRPKPKHWTKTKPIGSVAVIIDGQNTKTITKTDEDRWETTYALDRFRYADPNESIKHRTSHLEESKIHWIK